MTVDLLFCDTKAHAPVQAGVDPMEHIINPGRIPDMNQDVAQNCLLGLVEHQINQISVSSSLDGLPSSISSDSIVQSLSVRTDELTGFTTEEAQSGAVVSQILCVRIRPGSD